MTASGEVKTFKTHCVMCADGCGLTVEVRDGRISHIDNIKEHPVTALCPKGRNLADYVYSPDRLKYPMKKVNGTFQRISWDEALGEISAKLLDIKKRYGAHSAAVYVGMPGVLDLELIAFAQRFRSVFGTPNLLSVESMCYRSRIFSRQLTFGTYPIEEPENAECIVIWGTNPADSRPDLEQVIRRRLTDPKFKLIVIDPRRIPLASSGYFLQARPGSDCAVALAMINVIINEGLYKKDFVAKWTHGFDKLVEHVQQYTPEWAEEVSWVPANDIRNIARIFASSASASIIHGVNTQDQKIGGVQTNRAFSVLQSITGNIGNFGGWTPVPYIRTSDLRVPLEERPLGHDVYPIFDNLWKRWAPYGQGMLLVETLETGKPYPIKALICDASNMMVTYPNTNRLHKALKNLELMVTIDVFMTDTARQADIVLPASTFLERAGLGYIWGVVRRYSYVMKRQKVIDPMYESKPDWQIWSELGRKCGFGEYFPWKTDEELLQFVMKDSQVSYQQLIDNPNGVWFGESSYGFYEKKGFNTPSGKIEIYSDTLAEKGYPALPTYIEPVESPFDASLARDYPLVLITGARQVPFIHSQGRNIISLRRLIPIPELEIHPSVAGEYGISQGEPVWLETKTGKVKLRVKVTEGIVPGVVSLPHGWSIANENFLTDITHRDPVSGFPELKPLQCRISKVTAKKTRTRVAAK